jgi:hypothetical protein
MKSTHQILSSSDSTAEAGGVPASKILHRRPGHTDRKPGGKHGHDGNGRSRPETSSSPVKISSDRCTECGSHPGKPFDALSGTATDILPPQAGVYELKLNRYMCPRFSISVTAPSPIQRNIQFGPRTASA